MPSPIAHSLAGYLVYRVSSSKGYTDHSWRNALFYIFCANLPDLDFIPGFIVGEPNKFHHGVSHSVGFAVLFGLLVGLFFLYRKNGAFVNNSFIFFGLYFSHIFLDYLADDTSQPYGEPLWWPISSEYAISPILIFTDIKRVSTGGLSFIKSLISFHNLWAVTIEILVFLPIVSLLLFLRRKRVWPIFNKDDISKGS